MTGADKVIRWSTAAAVIGIAVVAAVVTTSGHMSRKLEAGTHTPLVRVGARQRH